jgi:pectate lyase-like protein
VNRVVLAVVWAVLSVATFNNAAITSGACPSCGSGCPADGLSVASYGATGNGIVDDTKSIQDTINALPASGGTVCFPNGTYKISSTLTLGNGSSSAASRTHGIYLLGAAPPPNSYLSGFPTDGPVKLVWAGTGPGSATGMVEVRGPLQGWGIKNVYFDGGGIARRAIQLYSAQYGDSANVSIQNMSTSSQSFGVFSGVVRSKPAGFANVDSLHNSWRNLVVSVGSAASSAGIVLTGNSDANTDYNLFRNVFITSPGNKAATGVYLQATDSDLFSLVHFAGFVGTDTPIVYDFTVYGGWPVDVTFHHIDFGGSRSVAVSGTPAAGVVNHIYDIGTTNGQPANPALSWLHWNAF